MTLIINETHSQACPGLLILDILSVKAVQSVRLLFTRMSKCSSRTSKIQSDCWQTSNFLLYRGQSMTQRLA